MRHPTLTTPTCYPFNYRSFRISFTVLCGNGFNDDNFTSQLAQRGYGRDRHLRTDDYEGILDDEGKGVPTDWCSV